MSKIKISNFGPIKDGCIDNDGWIDIRKVTVFIGPQSSGKSTLSKLVSTLTWLEKSLVRGDLPSDLLGDSRVFQVLCSQQELTEYFTGNTQIHYQGTFYSFDYEEQNNIFKAKFRSENLPISVPKIQYISSARNLLTILYKISLDNTTDKQGNVIDFSSNIPFMVKDLNSEYIAAMEKLAKTGFSLPIDNVDVYYDNHSAFVKTGDKKVSMSAASSGIQSITPLLLVSKYLANEVLEDLHGKLKKCPSRRIKKIREMLASNSDDLPEKFDSYMMFGHSVLNDSETLEVGKAASRFIPSYFVNIVEEPEQNLFPETQAEVLYELLEYNNLNKKNQLVISTHSPYVLTALNNAILAADVFSEKNASIENMGEKRMVSFGDVSAYKMEDGRIFSILDEETRLIDASQIDSCSTMINKDYEDLMTLRYE